MEWYLMGENDDMTVPEYQEMIDTLDCDYVCPSSDDWSQSIDELYEHQKLPNKVTSRSINPTVEVLDVDKNKGLAYQKRHGETSFVHLTNQDDLSELREAMEEDQLDNHLDSSMKQMDDKFLKSLLDKEPLDVEIPYGSMTMEDLLSDAHTAPKNPTAGDSFVGSELSHQLWLDFPLSPDVDEEYGNTWESSSPSYFLSEDISGNPERLPAQEVGESSMRPTSNHQHDEMEVNALEEFKHIAKQLNLETRICFRDALYRLAQCSEYRSLANQTDMEEAIISEASEEPANHGMRHKKQKLAELKSNAVDRTVANLLFNQKNCDFPYPPPLPSSGQNKENTAGEESSISFTIVH